MPSIKSCLNSIFRKVDFFQTTSLLRYNGQSQYGTATGGFLSLSVLIIFVILFASEGLKTARKELISSTQTSTFEKDPSALTITASPQGGFMFALYVWYINLNDPTLKLFDIKLFEEEYNELLAPISKVEVPLVPCTIQHFDFNAQIKQYYSSLNLSHGLCPPLGHQFNLQGKISSSIFRQFRFELYRCDPANDSACSSNATYQLYQNFYRQFILGIPIVNTQLNTESQNYKQFYFDDINGFSFTDTFGTSSRIFIQEDVVETEESIFPFYSQVKTDKITNVPQKMDSFSQTPAPGQYVLDVRFNKSPKLTTYTRTFNKVDEYLSYVGGLIGTIIGLMFLLGKYNQKAYQISIAHKLFNDEDNRQIPSQKFNILYWMLMPIKSLLNLCDKSPSWKSTQIFMDSSQEVSMQLDITYIMRKLIFLDSAISKVVEKHELEAIYIREKPSITDIKKQRRLHFAHQLLQKYQTKEKGKGYENRLNNQDISHQASKQRIMMEQIQAQPHEKAESEEYKGSDLSELELSSQGSEIEKIKNAVRKVHSQKNKGKEISQKILNDIKQNTLEQILVPQDKETIIKIQPAINEQKQEEPKHPRLKKRKYKVQIDDLVESKHD